MVDEYIDRLQRKAARLNKLGIVNNAAMKRINDAVSEEKTKLYEKTLTDRAKRLLTSHSKDKVELKIVIRTARDDMRMSQRQFGAYVGKSETTIQRWETGRQTPSDEAMNQVRERLLAKG